MVDSILEVLEEHGVRNERIGIDNMAALEAFQERGLKIVNGWPAMSAARVVKTWAEIELLKIAVAIGSAAMWKIKYEWLKSGVRERDIEAKVHEFMLSMGCEVIYDIIVASGGNTSPYRNCGYEKVTELFSWATRAARISSAACDRSGRESGRTRRASTLGSRPGPARLRDRLRLGVRAHGATGGQGEEGASAERHARQILERWAAYAPDLPAKLLAFAVHTPLDTERWIPSMVWGDRHHGSYHPANFWARRPHPALSHYRTPIEGLYLCGSGTFPGGSLTGQPGYNAATVIAEDLGYPRGWRPRRAEEVLAALEREGWIAR